jgi:hypothetical protein
MAVFEFFSAPARARLILANFDFRLLQSRCQVEQTHGQGSHMKRDYAGSRRALPSPPKRRSNQEFATACFEKKHAGEFEARNLRIRATSQGSFFHPLSLSTFHSKCELDSKFPTKYPTSRFARPGEVSDESQRLRELLLGACHWPCRPLNQT